MKNCDCFQGDGNIKKQNKNSLIKNIFKFIFNLILTWIRLEGEI